MEAALEESDVEKVIQERSDKHKRHDSKKKSANDLNKADDESSGEENKHSNAAKIQKLQDYPEVPMLEFNSNLLFYFVLICLLI